jgi:hypothetical protein
LYMLGQLKGTPVGDFYFNELLLEISTSMITRGSLAPS